MSDNTRPPSGEPEPLDPWAPPERKVPLDKPSAGAHPPIPPVHDQPTVTAMPAAARHSGTGTGQSAVPPPPIGPNGPGQPVPGPYGYPAYPASPAYPDPGGPTAPYGATQGYPNYQGYPGYPGYGHGGWGMMPQPQNGMGVTALVLGIISVCIFCSSIIAVVFGVVAIIFGVVGRGRVRRGEATNGGQALAGIILGVVGIVLGAGMLALVIAGGGSFTDQDSDSYEEDPFSASLIVDNAASHRY
ncbi:DUF4190 domain-containing protein [Streptomyces sp. A3M-1-3]|uniref:DUF4190 domain-containing protein n=1 Tax=Streptomyces sp. A3M-1-3 TaxID=2962044 RepID=UPI0020B762B1|nr:DUF4190 domain-containing protein [Streptomyces sp. A3M-1-3]MCP3816662.1 DUF4190 domain-containing protein [Streptomyces sp. A3M-1-3]